MGAKRYNSFKISQNYFLTEFQCPCCQTVKVANRVVELLEEATRQLGEKLEILSAYRCYKHNQEVGGVPNSFHTQGLAVDLRKPSKFKSIREFGEFMERVGFTGIGLYYTRGFLHVDLGPRRKWEE